MGLDSAAFAECGGVKIQHDRAGLQRVSQGKFERHAAKCGLRSEIRGRIAGIQGRVKRRCEN
jgi:hypothetical protein